MLKDIIYRNLSGRIPIVYFILLVYSGLLHTLLPLQVKEVGLLEGSQKKMISILKSLSFSDRLFKIVNARDLNKTELKN